MAPTSDVCFSNNSAMADSTAKNFISGVTVLISLFGRDATNRFLSQSVSIFDWLIFALAPLGVPTAIIAVIRTSQMQFLKRMVGLAEDKGSDVEKDLMSSTSDEVSEIWDGEKVVRVIRPSTVSELFFTRLNTNAMEEPYGIYSSQEAKCRDGVLETRHEWSVDHDNTELQLWDKHPQSQPTIDSRGDKVYPPNMMLNLGPYNRLPSLWTITILGIFLEAVVLIVASLTTFYRPLVECFQSQDWPFYLFAIGTALLFIGLVACAAAIDGATRDVIWKPRCPGVTVMWLQRGSGADGNASYVITKRIKTDFITSHRPDDVQPLVKFSPLIISSITIGFFIQATGLSTMHWPPQVLQFIATIAMFVCRSYLRRQDSPDRAKKIVTGCCEDWIAKMFVLSPENLWSSPPSADPDVHWKLEAFVIDSQDARFGECRCAQNLLQTRRFLANMTEDGGHPRLLASSLASAIDNVIQATSQFQIWKEVESWSWTIGLRVDDGIPEELELTIQGTEKELHADEKALEALISLLLSNIINRQHTACPKRGLLFVAPSDQRIAQDLRDFGPINDLGLYQVPPVDQSQDLRLSVDRDMIPGIDEDFLETARREEDGETVTFETKRISEPSEAVGGRDAALTRISTQTPGELFAQHIFVCFMWIIARELNQRGNKVYQSEAKKPSDKRTLPGNLKRSWLKILMRKIELTRLGNMDFANFAVIPPLSHYHLLDRDDLHSLKRNSVSHQPSSVALSSSRMQYSQDQCISS
ncbi:hypothetical protein BJX66DRAFT_298056 [Aspergillus keveii]|uniref:Uncharacterized protein n=1 Tax=Aspergillus keveii TaxID=714993 RepID=A0ABR4GE15_9EURO